MKRTCSRTATNTKIDFTSVLASTIEENNQGLQLPGAWCVVSHERNPDTGKWVRRQQEGQWTNLVRFASVNQG